MVLIRKIFIVLTCVFAAQVRADNILIQAPDGTQNLELTLQTYINANMMYEEFDHNFYVLDFLTGNIALFHVTQTNPLEPHRHVVSRVVSQQIKSKALASRDQYLRAHNLLKDIPEIPASIAPNTYDLSNTSAYQTRLLEHLTNTGALVGWREAMEIIMTSWQSDLISIREVEMVAEVRLADGGKVLLELIKSHKDNFIYRILALKDRYGNVIPLFGEFPARGFTLLVSDGDVELLQMLVRLLQQSGMRVTIHPGNPTGGGNPTVVPRIVCNAASDCVVET